MMPMQPQQQTSQPMMVMNRAAPPQFAPVSAQTPGAQNEAGRMQINPAMVNERRSVFSR